MQKPSGQFEPFRSTIGRAGDASAVGIEVVPVSRHAIAEHVPARHDQSRWRPSSASQRAGVGQVQIVEHDQQRGLLRTFTQERRHAPEQLEALALGVDVNPFAGSGSRAGRGHSEPMSGTLRGVTADVGKKLDPGPVRRSSTGFRGSAPRHEEAPLESELRGFRRQARLSDTGLAIQRAESALPERGFRQQALELFELLRAPDQHTVRLPRVKRHASDAAAHLADALDAKKRTGAIGAVGARSRTLLGLLAASSRRAARNADVAFHLAVGAAARVVVVVVGAARRGQDHQDEPHPRTNSHVVFLSDLTLDAHGLPPHFAETGVPTFVVNRGTLRRDHVTAPSEYS
jgi:hypothetical protein